MAAKKRKSKTSTRKKAVKRRAAARTTKKATKKKVAKKAARKPARKAAAKKAVKRKVRKAASRGKGEIGEGNYEASRRFRKQEEAFVRTHKADIPAMGKAAEAALEGPEGDALRAAEAEAAGRAAD